MHVTREDVYMPCGYLVTLNLCINTAGWNSDFSPTDLILEAGVETHLLCHTLDRIKSKDAWLLVIICC